jgi:hypothetical protein
MPISRKVEYSGRNFAIPVLLILVLLVSYWLLADWHVLPRLLASAFAAVH